MSNNFTGDITLRTPRPRSRRLRETGGTGGSVSAPSQSSAVPDHNQLFGRDSENAHPVNAITGLSDFMAVVNEMFTLEGAGTSASPYVIKAKLDLYTNDSLAAKTIYLPHGGVLDRVYDLGVDTNAVTAEVPSEGGGSAVWGNITGTLANQTDLANALAGKQPLIDASNKLAYSLISGTPTDVSEFTNNAGYLTASTVRTQHVLCSDYMEYRDTRSTNPPPYSSEFYGGIEYALKINYVDGLDDGQSFHGVLTLHQWGDNSGGAAWQLGFTNNGNIYCRNGENTWGGWMKIYHSGNCNNESTPWNVSTLVAGTSVYSNILRDRNGAGQWMVGVTEGTSDLGVGTTAVPHKIGFYTASGEVMTIVNGGNVGIGSISPSQKLTVNGGVCMNTLYLPLNNTMSTAYSLQVNTSAIVAEIPS